MPSVAVIETEFVKFGDVVCPLPASVAELAVMVYVPAGSAVPLSTRLSLVMLIETFPVAVAE